MTGSAIGYVTVLNACKKYFEVEQGDTNYEIAQTWIQNHWGNAIEVAGGIRIIEETWNRAFYAFGIFDMNKLQQTLNLSWHLMDRMKIRHVNTFNTSDEKMTADIWSLLFEGLKPMKRQAGPSVATAKALHLLMPNFYVAFDNAIAQNYRCNIKQPDGYIKFMHTMARLSTEILNDFMYLNNTTDVNTAIKQLCGPVYMKYTGSHYSKSLAKILDEYNWITR